MKIMEISILLTFELIFVDGELGLESNFCSLVAREHFSFAYNYLTNWRSEKYVIKELRDGVAKDQIKCLIGGDIF